MHSLLQPNLASPAKPSMSIPYPPAFASSGITQPNNVRLAPSVVFSGASSDPSQACARGFTLCPRWRLSSGSHRPILPSTLLANHIRLAPAVFFSSLPATSSDALLGHQLKRHYVRSICGSKCKNQINLWISPRIVHCGNFSARLRGLFPKGRQYATRRGGSDYAGAAPLASICRMPRRAWRVRSSFSISAKRTWSSP